MEKQIIKLGVFGCYRGAHFYQLLKLNGAEIVAVCDFNEERIQRAKADLGEGVTTYTNFDEFINHEGLEAVLIANYFHEHAPYAIAALEKGIHVLSECTSNGTMAEGVALVRAAEKSSAIYMLAENYPYMLFNQEMRRVYQSGILGRALYCEGEYNHPTDPSNKHEGVYLCPGSKHWRYNLPRTYYITHSLAPLMYITGARPKRVTAMPVYTPELEQYNGISRGIPEKAAIITCLNDDDSVYRVTGCAGLGAHENSYRVCGENGQIENLRDRSGRVILNLNNWQVPEGVENHRIYQPELIDEDMELIEKAGHGGGDFFVIREFLSCIREGRQPMFDVYFATTMASVAILAHKSMLAYGEPYDIPDFRRESDRGKYEHDTTSPFWSTDGKAPTISPTGRETYWQSPEGQAEYDVLVAKTMQELNAK